MDPPDFYDDIRRDQDARDASKQHQDDPGPSTKRAREMPPTEGDLLAIGREIQNRSKMRVGSDLSEICKIQLFLWLFCRSGPNHTGHNDCTFTPP